MSVLILVGSGVGVAVMLFATGVGMKAQSSKPAMTNQSVYEIMAKGASVEYVLVAINQAESVHFTFFSDDFAEFSRLKVPPEVLKAMKEKQDHESPHQATESRPQQRTAGTLPSGSKVFIAPMEGNLQGFIAAEIIKQKLPMVVTRDEPAAEYILTGASLKADDRWYHVVFGGKDKNEANVELFSVRDRQLVWAGEAGDRSLFYGNLRRGGQRKVADRIVGRLKHDLFK